MATEIKSAMIETERIQIIVSQFEDVDERGELLFTWFDDDGNELHVSDNETDSDLGINFVAESDYHNAQITFI